MKTRSLLAFVLLYAAFAAHAFAQQQPTAANASQNVYDMTLPGKNWSIELTLPDLTQIADDVSHDGKTRLFGAADAKNGIILLVTLAPAHLPGGAREFQDFMRKEFEKAKSTVKVSEYKQTPILEYTLMPPDIVVNGAVMPLNLFRMRRISGLFVKDDVWIEVTMARKSLDAKERALFYSILDTLKFAEPTGAPDALHHYRQGKAFYMQRDYAKAVEHYRRALDLERQRPQLDRRRWNMLVDELGSVLGNTGDLKSARETFELGLSQDNSYPLFDYHLAGIYAAGGDLDSAITHLRRAFANKANLPPNSYMNPAQETTFKPYLKDARMRRLLDELKIKR
ncbi:MAG TPA: tetratricopeptide repeat protein [Pyrinomonadaceae bacterium]|nr:tetratricopeptide repeat protein [Pyrinomonadaceae bacterium]